MFPVPTSFFLTSGVGIHRERLTAFELALRKSGYQSSRTCGASSIRPPHCEQVERESGVGTWMSSRWRRPTKILTIGTDDRKASAFEAIIAVRSA